MTIEKLNRIFIGITLLSFFLFFAFLNIRYAKNTPEIFVPSDTIEIYTTSEIPYFSEKSKSTSTNY